PTRARARARARPRNRGEIGLGRGLGISENLGPHPFKTGDLDLPWTPIYKRAAMPGARSRPPRLLFILALALAVCLGLLGCAADRSGRELFEVFDVAPREVEVGDRIEVLGRMLLTGGNKEATVTFDGELHRPGQPPTHEE